MVLLVEKTKFILRHVWSYLDLVPFWLRHLMQFNPCSCVRIAMNKFFAWNNLVFVMITVLYSCIRIYSCITFIYLNMNCIYYIANLRIQQANWALIKIKWITSSLISSFIFEASPWGTSLQYSGGLSILLGDTISTFEGVQYCGRIHTIKKWYHSVLWRMVIPADRYYQCCTAKDFQ